jgi:uncharacterized protein YjbI with pentapeptide repeats
VILNSHNFSVATITAIIHGHCGFLKAMFLIMLVGLPFLSGHGYTRDLAQFQACGEFKRLSSGEIRTTCRPLQKDLYRYKKDAQGNHYVEQCQRSEIWAPSQEQFNDILVSHARWLNNPTDGERANLCGADLRNITLPNADQYDFSRAILSSAILNDMDFSDVNLTAANLCSAELVNTRMHNIQANGAVFWRVNATGTRFTGASLCSAGFAGAILDQANFWDANLQGARLTTVSVNGTRLLHANFHNMRYQPLTGVPEPDLGSASGLGSMHVTSYPRGLTQLRHIAKLSGNPEQFAELSASLARFKAHGQLTWTIPSDIFRAISSVFFIVFVGLPTNWGLSLWIPFILFTAFFWGFSTIYYLHIRSSGRNIVVVHPTGRIIKQAETFVEAKTSTVLTVEGAGRGTAAKYAILYSLQATFFSWLIPSKLRTG